jgi:hypothetical protein
MNDVIIRVAGSLVPAAHRAEWLAEWRSELWYVARGGHRATVFCLGAFRDALWLRRNAPLPRVYGSLLIDVQQSFPGPPPAGDSRLLESPVRCLAFLGLLAALSLAVFFLLPGARHSDRRVFLSLLTMFAVAWLIVPATTTLSLGDYPANRHWLRRRVFFAAKIALIFPTMIFSPLPVAASMGPAAATLGAAAALGSQLAFWGGVMAIRWALLDQRRRCPVCLRLLANPVRIGQSSRIFLDWNGTELVCLRGHGLLHVPESPAIWFSKQRWLYFDPSWTGLF